MSVELILILLGVLPFAVAFLIEGVADPEPAAGRAMPLKLEPLNLAPFRRDTGQSDTDTNKAKLEKDRALEQRRRAEAAERASAEQHRIAMARKADWILGSWPSRRSSPWSSSSRSPPLRCGSDVGRRDCSPSRSVSRSWLRTRAATATQPRQSSIASASPTRRSRLRTLLQQA